MLPAKLPSSLCQSAARLVPDEIFWKPVAPRRKQALVWSMVDVSTGKMVVAPFHMVSATPSSWASNAGWLLARYLYDELK